MADNPISPSTAVNHAPGLPLVAEVQDAGPPASVHDDEDDAPESHPPSGWRGATPRTVHAANMGGSASHVDLGHFDPEGMNELRRTMSRQSNVRKDREGEPEPVPSVPHLHRESHANSEKSTIHVDGAHFDFEQKLRTIIKSLDASDVKRRQLGVMFQDLRVVGLGAATRYQDTLGSMFSPSNIAASFKALLHPPVRDILNGFEGVVRPGEMLLVLGRPGSGCSTLLKTLANHRGEYHAVEGQVHYDSLSPEVMEKHYRGDLLYCPEDDVHFPTLTVDETLRFATKTRIPRSRSEGKTRDSYVREMVDVLETLFGLRHAKNTPVGDSSVRGVSGGERKRVSISEALATRAMLGAWDNSTRGLDSSTALEFVRALRIATDVAQFTTIVSIYQAGEQLYELFDKVCIIYEGKMAYFGPANQARQYFINLGYEPAHRQTTADFLVAVTDPNGRIPRAGMASPVPITASEFASHFQRHALGEQNRADMAAYRVESVGKPQRMSAYMESAHAERGKRARRASPYTISIPMQARAVMMRRVQVIKGNLAATVILTVSFIFQATVVGTVFLQLKESTDAYFSRGGVLFFSILFAALSTMAEIPGLFPHRPIVERHHKRAMYHPFIEALAFTLVDLPITFFTMVIFSILIYFIVGLQSTAAQFFTFLLFVYTMTVVMKAWFRLLAAAFKSPAPAQTVAGISILLLALYTGYTIPRPSMIGALRWITYINPLRYGFAGILVNEFHTLRGACANLVPRGPGYENVSLANQVCASVGARPGESTVDGNAFVSLSYGYHYSELWRNFGIIVAFGVAFVTMLLVVSELNTSLAGESSVILFKRGSKAPIVQDAVGDEEKANVQDFTPVADPDMSAKKQTEQALAAQPKMRDVFSWQDIEYTVTLSGNEQRRLLDDISGYVLPGKLTALMGESGAGKTTLLNVLAERTSTGVVRGDRFVNGQALPADFQAQTGYVQQLDTHLETNTVREALLFSAKLRQPRSVPLAEKEAYVEQCLKMCGLEALADAIVGSLGVEHRKRTTIGVELAAKPKLLLFLDEPTSGLDSQSAWGVMDFLRSLADNGTAILCTIHQPSAELFQRFDRLLLLKKGGQTVYFGDLGQNAANVIGYFERNGGRPIQSTENPAEYMLEVIGAGATATTDIEWYDVWKQSPEAYEARNEIQRIHEEGRNRPPVQTTLHSEFATSWLSQVSTLLYRNAQNVWRDPTYLLAKLLLNIVGGLVIGFTFWQAKDSQQGTQNKLFSIFMGTILSVPLANQLQVPFIHVRSIYETRERPSRMYSWTALVTSQLLIELPWNILGSSLFFVCWYWTVGLDNSRAGFTYLLFGVIFPLYYTSIGQAIAAMAPTAEIAAILFSAFFSFVLVFNGVMQPFRLLGWWKWMYRLSPYTYLESALLGQAVGRKLIYCEPVEFVTLNPPSGMSCGDYMQGYMSFAGGYLVDASASAACQFCSTRTTDEFLAGNFNIRYSDRWWHLGIFVAYIVFNVAATFALTWLFRIRTGNILGAVKACLSRRRQVA